MPCVTFSILFSTGHKINAKIKVKVKLSLGLAKPHAMKIPSSAEVKEWGWSYTSTPPIRLHGVVLG
jgi:hypothetical protein